MSHEQGVQTYQGSHSNKVNWPESWKYIHTMTSLDKEPTLVWICFNFGGATYSLISPKTESTELLQQKKRIQILLDHLSTENVKLYSKSLS